MTHFKDEKDFRQTVKALLGNPDMLRGFVGSTDRGFRANSNRHCVIARYIKSMTGQHVCINLTFGIFGFRTHAVYIGMDRIMYCPRWANRLIDRFDKSGKRGTGMVAPEQVLALIDEVAPSSQKRERVIA